MIKNLIGILSVALLPATLNAAIESLDDAVEAMHRGDFAKAYCVMQPLAESGDIEAQYNIGWMYHNGYGLRVDDRKALEWWTLASEQGHSEASFSIGMLYSLGEGKIRKDLDKAIDFYLIAAENGQEDAIKLLKNMLMRNVPAIRSRMQAIVERCGSQFGEKRQVSAERLNARVGPSINEKAVVRLQKGATVLELFKKGRWSQVVVMDDENIDRTVWVSNRYLAAPSEKSHNP